LAIAAAVSGCAKTTPIPPPLTVTLTSKPATTAAATSLTSGSPTAAPTGNNQEGTAIVDKMAKATAAIKTYQMESTIKSVSYSQNDKSDQTTTTTTSLTDLDLANQQMKMLNKETISQPKGQPSWPLVKTTIYVTYDRSSGHMMYVQGLFPDNPLQWGKTPIGPEVWKLQDQAQELARLLKSGPVQVLMQEKIMVNNNNVLCDVLAGKPALSEYWALIANQPGIEIPAKAPEGVAYEKFVKMAEIKVWIDQTRRLPVKADLVLTFSIGPDLVPARTKTVNMEINVSMLFETFDQNLTIQLPAEAQKAGDLSFQKADNLTANQTPVQSQTGKQ
jgi:hypothetical protein